MDANIESQALRGFFKKHWPEIFLAVLIGYVILLGIGVVAEVFKIDSVLHWWIWRAPGQY